MKFNSPILLAFCLVAITVIIACKKEQSCETCVDGNKPPIARAGNDRIITLPQDSALLDGSNSSDPDGTIAQYNWSKIAGPSSFSITNSYHATTIARLLVPGSYQFELRVTDNKGLSAKDTVLITVDAVATSNHPPIANAGDDTTIFLPASITILNGSRSIDPDNNISSYAWTKINGPTNFSITTATSVQSQVIDLVQGTYQFELKVTDAGGLFSKDTVQVFVNASTGNNQSPVALPNNDTLIQSTTSACNPIPLTITLDGSRSYDPDGNIVTYQWTGPGTISSPNSAITSVSGSFSSSTYYSLKVTDNNGATNTGAFSITILTGGRPSFNASISSSGTLSIARTNIAAAAAGNKIFFAGGYMNTGPSSWMGESRVDIYDITSNTWSTAELSVPRHGVTAVTAGNKVFFAGGHTGVYGDISIDEHSIVDIYDLSTNSWSTANLSQPRGYMSAVTVGNKVIFAGGYWIEGHSTFHYSNRADIYDLVTNTWSTSTLSEGRSQISAVVANNKAYFAGGTAGFTNPTYSDKIDIYDLNTNSWSVSLLTEPKVCGGIAINNKIYWGGGVTNSGISCRVEIRDANSGTTALDYLSHPSATEYALQKNNSILFTNFHEPFDLLDLSTNTWSVGILPVKRDGAGIIVVNNTIYIAGGWSYETQTHTNLVLKLEF